MTRTHNTETAWAGWQISLPSAWRMAKLNGTWNRGGVTFADAERPRLELAWYWVTRRGFDAASYARRHLIGRVPRRERKSGADDLVEDSIPAFATAIRRPEGDRTAGVCFSRDTNRILHWVYYHGEEDENTAFRTAHLPRWRDQPLSRPVRWRFFDVAFTTPPGFRLRSATLNLGDMQVRLVDPSGWGVRRHLCVRPIYPARLALARQSLEAWLQALFRKTQGMYRPRGGKSGQTTTVSTRHGPTLRLEGRLQFLLRFPLRPLVFRAPGCTEAILCHLEQHDKLLYLQVSAPRRHIPELRDEVLGSFPRPESESDPSESSHGETRQTTSL